MSMFYYRLPSLGLGGGSVGLTAQNTPTRIARFTVAL